MSAARTTSRLLRSALLLVGALSLAGCQSSSIESGIRIGDKTLEQFKAGETRETWVRAVLGEPTSIGLVSDEPAVTVLRYSTVQEERGGLLSWLLGGSSARNVATIYFVVKHGVVESLWADRAETPGLLSRSEKSGEKKD